MSIVTSAPRRAVELDRLVAAAVEEQVGLDLHGVSFLWVWGRVPRRFACRGDGSSGLPCCNVRLDCRVGNSTAHSLSELALRQERLRAGAFPSARFRTVLSPSASTRSTSRRSGNCRPERQRVNQGTTSCGAFPPSVGATQGSLRSSDKFAGATIGAGTCWENPVLSSSSVGGCPGSGDTAGRPAAGAGSSWGHVPEGSRSRTRAADRLMLARGRARPPASSGDATGADRWR